MIADPNHATKDPVPYTGVQFATIPEFQGIGTNVGQNIAAALTGSIDSEGRTGEITSVDHQRYDEGRLHQVND